MADRENQTMPFVFPFWKVLPWCLFGAAALLLLSQLLPQHVPASSNAAAVSSPVAPVSTAAAPGMPASGTSAAPPPVPLTVTLNSIAGGRHIPVGRTIVISALAALPPGQSVTLAVSYDKDGGPKALLSLAQGSLSSTAWTPSQPGRYRFVATALDSVKNSASSRRLSIWADAPEPILPQPHLLSPRRSANRRFARRPVPQADVAQAPPAPFHVAAATFPFPQNAAVLAEALRRRGLRAAVRSTVNAQKQKTYTVETGDYSREPDAQRAMQQLRHDGYPAYLFRH